jgi:hypothetical protein
MKTAILDYAAIMEIDRRDREKRLRRHSRHVRLQNFAARYGYRFLSRVFNTFNL